MSLVRTYNPSKIVVIFGGVPITGYADGTFVTVTPSGQRWTKSIGADGETARAKSNDYTYEVTLTLQQTSPSNTYLSTILSADRNLDAGALPLQIIDIGGLSLFFWLSAWIRQPPDVEFGKEITERAWVFDTARATQEVVGGALF